MSIAPPDAARCQPPRPRRPRGGGCSVCLPSRRCAPTSAPDLELGNSAHVALSHSGPAAHHGRATRTPPSKGVMGKGKGLLRVNLQVGRSGVGPRTSDFGPRAMVPAATAGCPRDSRRYAGVTATVTVLVRGRGPTSAQISFCRPAASHLEIIPIGYEGSDHDGEHTHVGFPGASQRQHRSLPQLGRKTFWFPSSSTPMALAIVFWLATWITDRPNDPGLKRKPCHQRRPDLVSAASNRADTAEAALVIAAGIQGRLPTLRSDRQLTPPEAVSFEP